MQSFLNIIIMLSLVETILGMKDEPRCYSRFDWEDKLLEKTIRTDIKVDQLMQKFEGTIQEIRDKNLGTTYIRWGRTTCPGNGSKVVYDGYAGGSWYGHTGAAASMLCLPKDPDWDSGKYSNNLESAVGYMFGVEYQDGQGRSDNLFGESHYEHDVPCVVCDVRKRSSVIMVPGKTSCYNGWRFEYSGYLMTGHHGHLAASDYYCIDKDPENLPNGGGDSNGYLLYFVESRCGSLRCPPYVNGRELQCVVCSK